MTSLVFSSPCCRLLVLCLEQIYSIFPSILVPSSSEFSHRHFSSRISIIFCRTGGQYILTVWPAHCSFFVFKLSREPCHNAVCKYPLIRLSTHPLLVQAWKSHQAIHILQKSAVIGVHQAVLLWMLQVVLNCSRKKWTLKIQLFDAFHYSPLSKYW